MNTQPTIAESSLRARKRRDTRAKLLSEAIRLFRIQGIRSARLDKIARASGVSQATLFNYFPNKGALAEAWVRGELDQALRDASDELVGRGLRPAMRLCCRDLADRVSVGAEREVRLEAWREAGRAASTCPDADHPLVQALRRGQESEQVRGDFRAEILAEMLVETMEGALIAGLQKERTAIDLAKTLRARVDLILDGARKRNERVAAPQGTARAARSTLPEKQAPSLAPKTTMG